jgi:hypothetical protein
MTSDTRTDVRQTVPSSSATLARMYRVNRSPRHPVLTALTALAMALAAVLLFGACGGQTHPAPVGPVVTALPFIAGERLTYDLLDDNGAVVGTGALSVEAGEGDTLRLVQAYQQASAAGGQSASTDTATVTAQARTLQPRAMTREIAGRGDDERYTGTYAPDGSTVDAHAVRGGADRMRTLRLRPSAYENESSLWLWRTLDFAEGYDARYTSVNLVDQSQQTVSVRITGTERIEVPAGSFETWRVQIRNGRATRIAWIAVADPHVVVQWDNGAMTMRLTGMQLPAQRKATP